MEEDGSWRSYDMYICINTHTDKNIYILFICEQFKLLINMLQN